ncbi:MAG: CBS domain-containing protein, partial [Verrucomicrobiales bacterium]|nr:CBS domain-containing protein [Verrucomicrobiales bacterium]
MPEAKTQSPPDEKRPWQTLSLLVHSGASGQQLHDFIDDLSPGDTALAISRLPAATLVSLLGSLNPGDAAELVDDLPDEQAADLLETIAPEDAAAIVDELPSDSQADVLAGVDGGDAEEIIGHMGDESATRVRTLLEYPEDTAGGIMISEFLSYEEHSTVGDVLDDLRANSEKYSDYEVGYTYITDSSGTLIGVLRQRDLLFAQRATPVASLMLKTPTSVTCATTLQDLIDFFDDHNFIGVPVVGASGTLAGVIRKAAVHEAAEERASKAFLNLSGIIGGEELRSMPLGSRCLRRLAFLAPNIILNLVAVTVIARNEATLQQVIALAIFLPIVSDMSGCSGNQA